MTYTPKGLADFVAGKILSVSDFESTEEPIRILDPAVGDGELLISLLSQLATRTSRPVSVYGFDIDGTALNEARHRIAAAHRNATIHLERFNFLEYAVERCGGCGANSLFATAKSELFDLIIANPPYVRTQIMGASMAQKLAAAFGLTGRVDLYHAFLIGMAQLLHPKGTAGIIVSNRFMTTKGGNSVRQALRDGFSLQHVWDLGDTKLFESAVLPAVILAKGCADNKDSEIAFSSIYETFAPAENEADDPVAALNYGGAVRTPDGRTFAVQHGKLSQSAPGDTIWRIANKHVDTWIATVLKNSWGTFRDIGKVRVGVKTCADSTFIRSDWSDLPEDLVPELLRPLITHHVARRYKASAPRKVRKILYPHENVQGRRRAIDLKNFPRTLNYLQTHRSALETRSYLIEAGRNWYELWVPQDPDAWDAPKLVFRDISEQPTFWVDLDGGVVNGDCYWLTGGPQSEDLLWLAAAVANSTFIEAFYDHRFNNKLYSGRRRFITQYVEQFPLPDPRSVIGREIISLSKDIYESVDTPDAETLSSRANLLVWNAFGLDIEEIIR